MSIRIETERLQLRPVTLDDVDALLEIWTRPEVRRYLFDDVSIERERASEEVEGSIAGFERRGLGLFALTRRGDAAVVGFSGFSRAASEPELMYGLVPELWGQGLTSEAARAVLKWCFDTRKPPRIYAAADPPNTASIRVMQKLGMRFDERRKVGNIEIVYYRITRDEFQAQE